MGGTPSDEPGPTGDSTDAAQLRRGRQPCATSLELAYKRCPRFSAIALRSRFSAFLMQGTPKQRNSMKIAFHSVLVCFSCLVK